MAARLASMSGLREARSFIQVMATCTKAPATADQPKMGLMAKIKASATKATGASMTAIKAGLAKNSRTNFKSFSTCMLPPTWRFKKPMNMAS